MLTDPSADGITILGFASYYGFGGAMITLTYMGCSNALGWHIFNPTANLTHK